MTPLRRGFEICSVLAAWPSLSRSAQKQIILIVRGEEKDLSINGQMAEVAAARAPQGPSSRAGAKPELPVCGQVAAQTKDGSPIQGRKGVN